MSVTRSELENYIGQLLGIDRFRDYSPNGLQVEGRGTIGTIVSGVTASQALIDAAITRQADALLVAVAQRLQQRLRTHDVLGHAGPDTFWVVLPSTDIGGALVVADDMRTLFEREPLQHNGQVLRPRFSIGVHGRVPVDGSHTPEAMVQAAQRAWHMARQAGGNRIEIEV